MPLTRRDFLKNTGRLTSVLFLVVVLFFLTGCYDDLFKYSIHQIKGEYSGRNINRVNSSLIENLYKDPDTDFTFAVVTDSHVFYDELERAVDIISATPGISFLIHIGDFSDTGLLFQYEETLSVLEKLPVPYVVVPGNHDLLGNGHKIFTDIFGTMNFSFTCNGAFFIIANNNNWESDIDTANESWYLLSSKMDLPYRIVVTHIPIESGSRFSEEAFEEYIQLCKNYNIQLSLHGHSHRYSFTENIADNTQMLVADGILNRKFYLVHVKSTGIEHEAVSF